MTSSPPCYFFRCASGLLFLQTRPDHVVDLLSSRAGIDKLLEKTINRRVDVSGKLLN